MHRIEINNIHPSDTPSREAWDRSKGVPSNLRVTLYSVAGTLIPEDGNHRLARLYERHGGTHKVSAVIVKILGDIEVRGFLGQIRDVRECGISSFADFVYQCNSDNFDRD